MRPQNKDGNPRNEEELFSFSPPKKSNAKDGVAFRQVYGLTFGGEAFLIFSTQGIYDF